MEKRDRPAIGKCEEFAEIMEETLGNLDRVVAEVNAVKRRLLEHLELARRPDL
jgi:hypothetical protein